MPIGTRILRRKPTDVKDVETHYGWSRALELLDIPADLSSKFDLKWMQENLTLDKFSTVKVPYVLVGVKSLERVGSDGDVYCDVEDPTGNILVIYLILYMYFVYIYSIRLSILCFGIVSFPGWTKATIIGRVVEELGRRLRRGVVLLMRRPVILLLNRRVGLKNKVGHLITVLQSTLLAVADAAGVCGSKENESKKPKIDAV